MTNMDAMVRHIASLATVSEAQNALRRLHGAEATRQLVELHNINIRTAQRWMSSTPPKSRESTILESVSYTLLAAQVLRRARMIHLGTVNVAYEGTRPEGTRDPYSPGLTNAIQVDSEVASLLHKAADALESERLREAEQYLSDAIMHGYQPGLEEALTITDYTEEPVFAF